VREEGKLGASRTGEEAGRFWRKKARLEGGKGRIRTRSRLWAFSRVKNM
jgi:hypothetical protein